MPCDTIWVPGCLFRDCKVEPVVMLDGINGLCREHRHRAAGPLLAAVRVAR